MVFSGIVKPLEIVEHVDAGFCVTLVTTAINPLALQHPEEAFSRRIVSRTDNAAHAANQVVPFQEAPILIAGELASAI